MASRVQGSADNTIINNVVSGNNAAGVHIYYGTATGNIVQGNYVGTNRLGDAPLGNGTDGILLSDFGEGSGSGAASNNTIGGLLPTQANLVSGNFDDGIQIQAGTLNTIAGNFIGTDSTGLFDLGNFDTGIFILSNADNNLVQDNTVAFNSVGVLVRQASIGNRIQQNSIFDNVLAGIELRSGELGNNEINAPLIVRSSDDGANTFITGTFSSPDPSHSNATLTVEFFATPANTPAREAVPR